MRGLNGSPPNQERNDQESLLIVSECCPEDLPRAMNDREEWRERVRDICAASTI